MAKQKINYDAINFKNKDVDKFSTKFGQGDPIKMIRDAANALKNAPAPTGNFEFKLEGTAPYGHSTPYIVDTTGLAAGKQSFDMRYGAGVPRSGAKVGEMSAETVKRLVKNQGKKKSK